MNSAQIMKNEHNYQLREGGNTSGSVHTLTNECSNIWVNYSTGQKMKIIFHGIYNNCMAGIISSLKVQDGKIEPDHKYDE